MVRTRVSSAARYPPSPDGEARVVHSYRGAVALAQVRDLDHRRCRAVARYQRARAVRDTQVLLNTHLNLPSDRLRRGKE